MALNDSQLPSSVEQTFSVCPQFRILIAGKSGVGKSSLISSVFNIDKKNIDIAHDRPGEANINYGYTSDQNTRFILHDSRGFEAGSSDNWNLVEDFLRQSHTKGPKDQIHIIWLCIQSPLKGARVLQVGDEKLLDLAKDLGTPVVVVFTKYDELFNEQLYMDAKKNPDNASPLVELEREAEACFNERIAISKRLVNLSVVKVSTDPEYPQRSASLRNLTFVTSMCLGVSVEDVRQSEDRKEDLQSQSLHNDTDGRGVPTAPKASEAVSLAWIAAQRTNPDLKIEGSVREGFKRYWRNLAKSSFFQDQKLEVCVWRIHDDILRVWNFRDRNRLLFNEEFYKKILVLAEPVLQGHEAEINDSPGPSASDVVAKGLSTTATVVGANPSAAAIIIGVGVGVIVGALALRFLYQAYQKINLTAQYLVAYIVHLTCILHQLLSEIVDKSLTQDLSEELVSRIVESHRERNSFSINQSIREMSFHSDLEEKMRRLIHDTIVLSDGNLQSAEIRKDAHVVVENEATMSSGGRSQKPAAIGATWTPAWWRRRKAKK